MISLLVKHFVFERALDVFFQTVQNNIAIWKASNLTLTNVHRKFDEKTGMFIYSTYSEGKIIKVEISSEAAQDLKAIHGIDIDETMIEALQFEVIVSAMGPQNAITSTESYNFLRK